MTRYVATSQYRRVVRDRLHQSQLFHGILVVAAIAIGQLEAWTVDPEQAPRVFVAVCALVATGALALVRVAPQLAAVVVVAALVAKDLARGPGELLVLLVCGVATTFAVGLLLPAARARLALLACLALAALGVALGPEDAPELVFSSIALGAPWLAGRLVRASREHASVLEELVQLRETEAREREEHAVMVERALMAREIHDLVGHSVSMMVVQAGAAEQVLASRPEDAEAALTAIQETGRAALDDLHRVLGLLRAEDGSAPSGLESLPALLSTVRGAGLQVESEMSGNLGDLAPGVSLAAYRIIQEALTNVVRHAGAATAWVRVARDDRSLELRVADDGGGRATDSPTGHGLIGIRERVSMYGGDLTVGPGPSGGFQVEARIPLAGPA